MILAIETSSPQASMCLFDAGKKVWSESFVTDRSHNSKIFHPLKEALDICERKLDLLVVGLGPGSYSGVRVGIAAANGIGMSLGVQVVGVSSLLAYDSGTSNYLVAGDARRKTFFWAEVGAGCLIGEPDLLGESEFASRIDHANGPPVYTMDQSLVDQFSKVVLRFPSAENLLSQRLLIPEHDGIPIEPHYLRLPYITQAKKKPVPGFPAR